MRSSISASRRRLMVAACVESLRVPRTGLVVAAGFLTLIALMLTVDARRNQLAPIDKPLIDAVQRVELPYLSQSVAIINAVTNSTWAVVLWGVTLLTLLAVRWWIPALAVLAMPWGGLFSNLIGVHVVVRTRPDGDGLLRSVGDWDAPSFPSGHVLGAVMLYGFLIYLAPRIHERLLRAALVGVSLLIIVTVGFARLWIGAHWPSDVLAAYALGGLAMVVLVVFVEQAEWTMASLAARFPLPSWLRPR